MKVVKDVHTENSHGTTGNVTTVSYPAEFPLPQFPDTRVTVASDTTIEKMRIRSVMLMSKKDGDTVCEFYKNWFAKNGWVTKTPAASMGLGAFISAQKNRDTANITALHPKDARETTVTINISSNLD